MPVIGNMKQPGRHPFDTRERRIEFWTDSVRAIRSEALDKPEAAPVPFAVDAYRIVPFRRSNLRQELRLQHLADEAVARSDRHLLLMLWHDRRFRRLLSLHVLPAMVCRTRVEPCRATRLRTP